MGTNHSELLSVTVPAGGESYKNPPRRLHTPSTQAAAVFRGGRNGLPCLFALVVLAISGAAAAADYDANQVIERMRSAYTRLSDYQMLVDSTTYEGGVMRAETRVLYRYKKPGMTRLEFLRPRKGWILVYPSKAGKVRVKPSGLLGFLEFDLAADSPFLTVWPGQQVTQTDLGLLIENMAHSLTDRQSAPAEISQVQDELVIRVKAENHFLQDVPTWYEFWVDAERWLPTGVHEEIPSTDRSRRIRFLELQTDVGLPRSMFQLP